MNINSNHPMIKNSNQYFMEKKFISIHSEDRDITKYPNSSEFEIMLPQEYLNIASARLYSWSFPANYNVFSATYFNITMTFKFTNLYNPNEHPFSNVLTEGIYAALNFYGDKEILLYIETGFYNPEQMSVELTNKFNISVTRVIDNFFNTPKDWGGNDYTEAKNLFEISGGYNRFKIVYHTVAQKLWFGNTADQFILTNESAALVNRFAINSDCTRKNRLPEWNNWGLPAYLGFTRCNTKAYTVEEYLSLFPNEGEIYTSVLNDSKLVPRFFYGDAVVGSGDAGYWLVPTLPEAEVYFLEAPFKISFMGPGYMYMEIDGWNCIDETSPYNLSLYTSQTNKTNGIANSSFAKIAIPTTPISQWFDIEMGPYKYWNPPAERIGKIKFKLRYHNGTLVQFGQFEFSFMIELNILKPQIEKNYNITSAFDLSLQHPRNSTNFT